MKSIVITGSSRGIGRGLAESFLEAGCSVTVNGRNAERLGSVGSELADRFGAERVAWSAGDVTSTADLEALWEVAVARFGTVDIWINNAGIGHPQQMVWKLPAEKVSRVVDIDLKGSILGAQVAISRMIEQGHGHLYNMEGFGSNGRNRPGITIYGATKAAVRFLTRSLAKEVADTPVSVSAISPGIVITEFLTDQYRDDPVGFERAKPIFNALGDRVEAVTPWIARRVLSNRQNGALVNWLTPGKIFWRFATFAFRKRDLFFDIEVPR